MPAAIPRSNGKSKGKARADPYEKTSAELPLGKQLAHTGMSPYPSMYVHCRIRADCWGVDKKVRDQAIRNLTAFVSRGDAESSESGGYTPLSDAEMSKLWKGLFYCTCEPSLSPLPSGALRGWKVEGKC